MKQMRIKEVVMILRWAGWLLVFAGVLNWSGLVSGEPERPVPLVDEWQGELKKFSEIYSHIKNYYPEEVDDKRLIFASITGLLRYLDPHSYFMDPVAMRSMNEDQQGNYYGIGTRITRYEDRLTVIAPLAGTPAQEMGIMAGDVIEEIEGKETQPLSLDECMRMLRGAKDSYVNIRVRREGIKELIPFRLKRVEIPLNSVSFAVVHPEERGIGYINVRTFGNTTAGEVEENLERLIKEHQVNSLVLDLRGNAGGSLYAAIDLADLFLEKGKVIVSVKGRSYQQSFTAKKDNQFEDMPVIVLINRGSASASEIVAAAIQENQRGLVIGSRSWGKGLVQTINRLSLNTSVALTTAKFYTPSNKCLQRDFNQLDDYLFFLADDADRYDTDRDIVGGVIPDIYVKSQSYPQGIVSLISRGVFFRFARHLVDKARVVPVITQQFQADQRVLDEFELFLQENRIEYDRNTLNQHTDAIRTEVEREVLSHKFSQDEGIKVFLKADPVMRQAVEELKKKIFEDKKN